METKILKLIIFLAVFNTLNCQIIFPSDNVPEDTPTRVNQNVRECFTPNRQRGTCVPIRDCQNLWKLVEKQASYSLSYPELVFLRNSQCGEQNGILVCCEARQIMSNPAASATTPRAPVTQTTFPPRTTTSNLLPSSNQCASVGERIYGGKETDLGEFPWMALIEYTKSNGKKSHNCGGSLINNRYVLTAAHCVTGRIPSSYEITGVRLGEWDLTSDPDCYNDDKLHCVEPHLDVPIEKTIPHPEYDANSRNQYNDIALVRLANLVNFTNLIQPICIPIYEDSRNISLVNATLTIAGWGKTETQKQSTKQQKANVKMISNEQCNKKYKDFNITIEENQMCASGDEGADTCNGDSGGPLINIIASSKMPFHYVAGIVSFGPSPCALSGWAGVYTKVENYVDWILENLEP